MNPYLLLPLIACVASAMLAVGMLCRDGTHRTNRVAAALTLGATFWAFCEVLWNTATDAQLALRLVRLSSAGWVAMGPLGLHLFLELTGRTVRSTRPLAALYALSATFLLVTLTTDWMHTGVTPTAWGWGYEFGPAYPFFWAFTTLCLTTGLILTMRHLRKADSPAERSQAGWIVVGVVVPLVMASLTDGILPMLGIQVPRLGTASFTFLGGTVLWSFYRYGYTLLAPGNFAREILDTQADGVALLRLDGRVRWANPALASLLGRSAVALEGTDMAARLPGVRLDAAAPVDTAECELVRSPDDIVAVAVSTTVLRDKRSLPLGLVLVVRDLREVAALRARLVTSGRLAAVGELAAGVAHEINNPIAYVRANLGALGDLFDKLDEPTPAMIREGRELLDESLDGVDRVIDIVRDIRGFAHQGTSPREPVDLNAVLDTVLRVATPQLRSAERVERNYQPLPPVLGSAQELQQVFLNLVVNAAQAIGDTGRIRIETEHDARWVLVSVEDDGAGIPADVVDRIFDPFFTTKPVGEGCGLGLAIAYQLVRQHDGDLQVHSRPGEGTRFSVRLPVGDGAQSSARGGGLSSSTSVSQGSSCSPNADRKGS